MNKENEKFKIFVDGLKFIFYNTAVLTRLLHDQNFNGARLWKSPVNAVKKSPKTNLMAIAAKADYRNRNVCLNDTDVTDELVEKYSKVYNNTYNLSVDFVKLQILPSEYHTTFSWSTMGKERRVSFCLMFEKLLADQQQSFEQNNPDQWYVLPLYNCYNMWGSKSILSTAIMSIVRTMKVCNWCVVKGYFI